MPLNSTSSASTLYVEKSEHPSTPAEKSEKAKGRNTLFHFSWFKKSVESSQGYLKSISYFGG